MHIFPTPIIIITPRKAPYFILQLYFKYHCQRVVINISQRKSLTHDYYIYILFINAYIHIVVVRIACNKCATNKIYNQKGALVNRIFSVSIRVVTSENYNATMVI